MISTAVLSFRQRRQKSKPKLKLSLIVLTIPLALSILFAVFYPGYAAGRVQTAQTVYSTTIYYVPVTHFKTIETTVSLGDLKAKELYFSSNISDEETAELQNILNVTEVRKIEPSFSAFSALGENAVLIIYPLEKDMRLKALSVDGINIYDKSSSLENYPLTVKIPASKDKIKEIAQKNLFARDKLTTLFVGGEIIAARAVDRLWIDLTSNSDLLFDRVKPYIEKADVALSMLENSYIGDPTPCKGCVTFTSDEKVIPTYKRVGFDVFSLAGNHEGDAGSKGYANTKKLLDEQGLKYFGSGDNIEAASKHTVLEANGIKFAFLGADDIAYFHWAGADHQGTNHFSNRDSNGALVIDKEKIKKDVTAARADADIVVVYMSWGIEYQNNATKHQKEMAQVFADAGVALVVASHPHWVQNAEALTASDGRIVPIFYSIGNFLFDQTHTEPTRQGVVLNIVFYENEIIDMQVIPHKTCGYHQSQNNLAYKIVSGEMTYADADNTPESQGCVWWQPTPLPENHPTAVEILERMWEYTNF